MSVSPVRDLAAYCLAQLPREHMCHLIRFAADDATGPCSRSLIFLRLLPLPWDRAVDLIFYQLFPLPRSFPPSSRGWRRC